MVCSGDGTISDASPAFIKNPSFADTKFAITEMDDFDSRFGSKSFNLKAPNIIKIPSMIS